MCAIPIDILRALVFVTWTLLAVACVCVCTVSISVQCLHAHTFVLPRNDWKILNMTLSRICIYEKKTLMVHHAILMRRAAGGAAAMICSQMHLLWFDPVICNNICVCVIYEKKTAAAEKKKHAHYMNIDVNGETKISQEIISHTRVMHAQTEINANPIWIRFFLLCFFFSFQCNPPSYDVWCCVYRTNSPGNCK